MPTLTIAPLALPDSVSLCAYKTVMGAECLFVQTIKHPSTAWIAEKGLEYASMDDVYDTVEDFDELNARIAQRLVCGRDAVFAVCGRGVYPELSDCIKKLAVVNNTDVVFLPSSGFAEAAACACGMDTANAYICSVNDLPNEINVAVPLYIEEIDTRIAAGELKLRLCDFYPEDTTVVFAFTDEHGVYMHRSIKLFELDRQPEYFSTTVVLLRAYQLTELDRHGMGDVEQIMQDLRGPNGCPWDKKQTHESLKASLIEEAYEVLDAIEQQDSDSLCEELGDLLLHIAFHTQIEREKSSFALRDVCTGIVKKMIFRHPHVFSNASGINTAEDVADAWAKLKMQEKQQTSVSDTLCAVPKSFPALVRSWKVQKRAAAVGFDWDNAIAAMSKIDEERQEVENAAKSGTQSEVFGEIGDLLFAVVNVARHLEVDAELALQAATDKFLKRFCLMEKLILEDGKKCENMSLEEMDTYWDRCKELLSE